MHDETFLKQGLGLSTCLLLQVGLGQDINRWWSSNAGKMRLEGFQYQLTIMFDDKYREEADSKNAVSGVRFTKEGGVGIWVRW